MTHNPACLGPWCILRSDPVVVRCRCGIVLFGPAWVHDDPAAALQYVDPDGVQTEFCDAAGLIPNLERALSALAER